MRNIFGAFVGFILGLVFAIVGFVVVYFFGMPIVTKAKASLEWPQVSGVVTASEIQSHRGDDGTTYSADVTFDYTVNDEKLSGDTVYFGDNVQTSSRSTPAKTVRKYPVGKEIQVHYSPESPDESVIEPGATWSSYFLLIFGSIFLAVGGLVALGSGFSLFGGGLILAGGAAGLLGSKRRNTPQNFGLENSHGAAGNREAGSSNRYNQQSVDSDHGDGFDIS
ncbi:MAG: DUF3592 domain-containing protein [Mariniblastus sp.]|nr:DUF3592 domain-containing protein [Mariniblastus sp.]